MGERNMLFDQFVGTRSDLVQQPDRNRADRTIAASGWLDLANGLSLSRVALALVPWLSHMRTAWVAGGMILAALTDVADGRVARRANALGRRDDAAARVGVWLDPVCDKVFVVSLAVSALLERRPPAWLVAVVLSRELLLIPLFLVHAAVPTLSARRIRLGARLLGKLTTVSQFATLVALLFVPRLFAPLALATGLVGIAAVVDYLRRATLETSERACALG
jgi:phosphatidylglycerophosphate synthase